MGANAAIRSDVAAPHVSRGPGEPATLAVARRVHARRVRLQNRRGRVEHGGRERHVVDPFRRVRRPLMSWTAGPGRPAAPPEGTPPGDRR
ncbi:hypothetical protein DL768_007509 [Monosporascus sp. mg162]|nr:hypothetical protein DL768_007509 [Monosporascus sp. mg162]